MTSGRPASAGLAKTLRRLSAIAAYAALGPTRPPVSQVENATTRHRKATLVRAAVAMDASGAFGVLSSRMNAARRVSRRAASISAPTIGSSCSGVPAARMAAPPSPGRALRGDRPAMFTVWCRGPPLLDELQVQVFSCARSDCGGGASFRKRTCFLWGALTCQVAGGPSLSRANAGTGVTTKNMRLGPSAAFSQRCGTVAFRWSTSPTWQRMCSPFTSKRTRPSTT